MISRTMIWAGGICATCVLACPDWLEAQQAAGSVSGTVVTRQGQPLSGAQVYLQNTRHGGMTNDNGGFLFLNVAPGAYTVTVQLIGFAAATQQVRVTSGGTAQVRLELAEMVLPLQELVVAGVTDPTAGVKLPFTVARVGQDQLQVPPAGSALSALAGKVAGASVISNSGKPGAGVQIQLRTPTFSEGISNNQPLLVVDGVVMSQSLQNPIQMGGSAAAVQPTGDFLDIDPTDIESIEVIKGAAAASLYGSRASAGVISITTRRGRGTELGQTRLNFRSEMGQDYIGRQLPLATHHHFRLTGDGRSFADATGQPTNWQGRSVDPAYRIADRSYPGQLYDNVGALYRPGRVLTQNMQLSQNSASTNFMIALNRLDQRGALAGNDGYWRNQGRVNIDHRIGDRFTVQLTGVHSRSLEDVAETGSGRNPYLVGLTYPPHVNLAARDASGNYVQVPDSTVLVENPLWVQQTRDHHDSRSRTNASLNTRFSATQWLSVDGQVSYDRSDAHNQRYTPKGVPLSPSEDNPSQGILYLYNQRADAYNGSMGVNALRNIGELSMKAGVRASFERDRSEAFAAEGRDFLVQNVRDLSAAQTVQDVQSSSQEIRSNAYMASMGFDFRDRYVFDGLIRRDGSSLFGPTERWHTYYRAAVSYAISREDWLELPHVDELVLRYSVGTAGGRPTFTQQYESWNVSRTTGLSRVTAGNSELKPHTTREQEAGITSIMFDNRLSVQLTYATQTSWNQIIGLAAPTISGFNSIFGNAGKIRGRTYEASLNARVLNTRDVTVSLAAVADRSRNKILEWERSCFFGHTITATLSFHEYSCAGESRGDFWGRGFVRTADQLPNVAQGRAAEFQVNDDGYMVWVGAGNSWQDGIARQLWGTSASIGGRTYFWGEPIVVVDENNVPVMQRFGSSLPDLAYGFTPNVRYRNLNLYAEIRGQVGGVIYNQAKQELYNQLRHSDVDQSGKPDERKKTVDYYQRGLRSGGAFAEHFVENGSFLKLGAVSARYRLPGSMLERLGSAAPHSASLGIAGRNLLTLTGYSGFDPESGRALSRVDNLDYPQLRTLTLFLDITF